MHNIKSIQKTLKRLGFNINVDGIYGPITRKLYSKNKEKVNELLANRSKKDVYMEYLGEAEGLYIHFNAGEKTFTTPYGVYSSEWVMSEPVSFVIDLYYKYILKKELRTKNISAKERKALLKRITPKIVDEMRPHIKSEERYKLRDLTFSFYMENFVNKDIEKIFDKKKFSIASLILFSNGVNAGFSRGVKCLQAALNITMDGIVGPHTLKSIEEYTGTQKRLGDLMLDEMERFYENLIRGNPNRFSRFKNGWHNRIYNLRIML